MTRTAPRDQAADAIREAIVAFADPTRPRPHAALVIDTAVDKLEAAGMAPDTAADLVARVWAERFEAARPV